MTKFVESKMTKKEDLKTRAENFFLRSKEEISEDEEIIVEKLKGKIVIIKETKDVEVTFKHSSPQISIPLYLIGKFVGNKILDVIDDTSADTAELSNHLNVPPKGLSRPIGILIAKGLIEKTGKGFGIRAFKIIDFLDSLTEEHKIGVDKSKTKMNSKSGFARKFKNSKRIKDDFWESLEYKGLGGFCELLKIPEEKLRQILFVREKDVKLIDLKFVKSTAIKEIQLDVSLALLLLYKYIFGLDRFPSALLRKKLQLLGIKSLVNLTTNLHKYPEYIIHDAGKIGSINNYFLITQPGENRIGDQIKNYLEEKKEDEN